MIIVLIGYMGSGKSTIGKNLSDCTEFDLFDLDDYIEKKENMSVSEIFRSKGEIYFRKKEHLYLKDLLQLDDIILSLGGGTPCYGKNLETILETPHVKSIYLKSSIPNLVKRLFNERSSRPLIAHLRTEEELTEFIGKHLFERSFFYNQSHHTVLTDGKNIDMITAEIIDHLF